MGFSRKHYQLVSPRKSTPEEAAERVRYRECATQALTEMRARFPVLTSDNLEAADKFREQRTQELLKLTNQRR
jgi:hypothetical protein